MDSRVAAVLLPPVYDDFDPPAEFVQEKDCDTYLLNLPGFRKDHLKVQLTTTKILRITGTRSIGDNKWSRFHKEFPVTPDHDTQRISAKFEGGTLFVRLPKLIPPPVKKEEKKEPKLPTSDLAPPPPEKPAADQPPPEKSDVQEPATEKPAQKDDSSNVKEEPKAAQQKNADLIDPDKKAKTLPDEKASGGMDESKEKSVPGGDKREDDSAKGYPEEKTKGLDDSEKKSIAGDKQEDDSAKDAEKRERESAETEEERGNTGVQNKERGRDVPSILKKHRRIFNLTLVVIFAVALGLHMTNFLRTLKRAEN